MNKMALLLSFILSGIMACSSSSSAAIECGMDSSTQRLALVIDTYKSCPECLRKMINDVIDDCPTDKALLLLGFHSSYKSGDLDGALNFYQKLNNNNYSTVDEHANAAYLYKEIGDNQRALDSFKMAADLLEDQLINYEIAGQLIALNRIQEAIQVLEEITKETRPLREDSEIQVIGDDAIFDEASMVLAESYLKIGSTDKAIGVYNDILNVYPDDVDASNALRELDED